MTQPIALALASGETPWPATSDPWCTPTDIAGCAVSSSFPVDMASVCRVASQMLYAMSGRKFGVRQKTIRPALIDDQWACGSQSDMLNVWSSNYALTQLGHALGLVDSNFLPLEGPAVVQQVMIDGAVLSAGSTFSDGKTTAGSAVFTSTTASFTAADVGKTISGFGTIASVTTMTSVMLATPAAISGSALTFTISGRAPAAYKLGDGRKLYRLPDPTTGALLGWPTSQRVDLDATQPGTFQIVYQNGRDVPDGGMLAARVLACQLAQLVAGELDSCAIPERVTALTRQGVSVTILDVNEFLKEDRTGLTVVDMWLNEVNPHKQRGRPTIINPDDIDRVRF